MLNNHSRTPKPSVGAQLGGPSRPGSLRPGRAPGLRQPTVDSESAHDGLGWRTTGTVTVTSSSHGLVPGTRWTGIGIPRTGRPCVIASLVSGSFWRVGTRGATLLWPIDCPASKDITWTTGRLHLGTTLPVHFVTVNLGLCVRAPSC